MINSYNNLMKGNIMNISNKTNSIDFKVKSSTIKHLTDFFLKKIK